MRTHDTDKIFEIKWNILYSFYPEPKVTKDENYKSIYETEYLGIIIRNGKKENINITYGEWKAQEGDRWSDQEDLQKQFGNERDIKITFDLVYNDYSVPIIINTYEHETDKTVFCIPDIDLSKAKKIQNPRGVKGFGFNRHLYLYVV